MKTKAASLLVVLSLITTLCMAQKTVTVEAQNSDISNNLDLKAVATVFGESKDLQEFEQRLNDYDSQISNLDLNKDGQVDYLRVIEKTENGVHVVEIQAVLDKDIYQDVASLVVEKDQNNRPTVQVIGDPYIYGDNYIIEPSYAYTPSIFSFFWGPSYYRWNSPYYYGYYPSYYHHREPCELGLYYSNVYSHVDHNQRYYYTNNIRNESAARMINSVRRNDLAVRHPERSFSNRNENVRNKSDFEFNRSGSNTQTRSAYQGSRSSQASPSSYQGSRSTQGSPSSYQGSPSGSRAVRTFDNNNNNGNRNQSYQNGSRTNSNGNIRTNMDNRNSTTRTYTTPSNVQQNLNPNAYRDQNRSYQSRPTYNPNVQQRSNNSVTRDYNNNYRQAPSTNSYRQAPSVSQPSRESQQSQPRQQVQRNTNSNPSPARQAPAQRVESSKESRNSDSGRR